MTDMNNLILNLIKSNKSMKDICHILKISEKQLFIRIKQIINYGYNIKPNYNIDSDIYYEIIKGKIHEKTNLIKINTPIDLDSFRCLVISDIHVGNIDSNIDLLNYVYEYASKNGINYILNCGDNIEGDYTTSKRNINNVEKQVETFINKHPYDKDIKDIMIFGNHDRYSLKDNGFDVARKIENSRHDLISAGYGQANVNIKDDNLVLFHKLTEDYKLILNNDEKIILSGHGHMMKTKLKDELWLCIPTLSNSSVDKTKEILPGFIDLKITFDNNKFDYVEAKHLIITPKVIEVSESKCKVKDLNKFKWDS